MTSRVVSLRTAVANLCKGRPARAVRFPHDLRDEITALALQRRARGESLKSTAARLGLRVQTLYTWQRKRRAVALRRIRVVAPAPPPATAPGQPVLVTPQGFRVEGLGPGQLAELLRALA